MSRQVCVSQDDPAHSDRDTTHYWELRETVRVMRTTARQRKRTALWRRWPRDTKQQAPQAHFLKLVKYNASTAVHMKPFTGRVRSSTVF